MIVESIKDVDPSHPHASVYKDNISRILYIQLAYILLKEIWDKLSSLIAPYAINPKTDPQKDNSIHHTQTLITIDQCIATTDHPSSVDNCK
jgi:hypothetical protein